MKPHTANTRLNEFEYRQGRTVLESWPCVIDLGLTLKCNLHCDMCFSRALPSIDLAPACVEKVEPYLQYCHRIVWNDAGEIFASNRTPDFVELMKKYRPPVSYVSTNGQLIDRHIDDILDSGLTDMSVSIDAARRETYERIRAGAKWDKLIANLQLLKDKKRERGTEWPRLTFVFVAMRSNLSELPDFVEFAREHGAVAVHVLKMLPTPGALELTECPTDEEEMGPYGEALQRARKLGIDLQHTSLSNDLFAVEPARVAEAEATNEGADEVPPPGPVALEALHRRRFDPASGNVPICPAPWREFLIQTDGKVRVCCFSSAAIMGDLNRQSLPEIWNGPAYQAFRRRIASRDFSACKNCPFLCKMEATEQYPLKQTLANIRKVADEKSHWVRLYRNDIEWMTAYLDRWRRGPRKVAVREIPLALRKAVKIGLKNLVAKPKIAKAWEAQNEVTERMMEAVRLAQHENRKLREDLNLLAEVARLRAQQGLEQTDAPPSAIAVDPAQDPIDALFYSARIVRHETPEQLTAGNDYTVPITIQNTSAVAWPVEGDYCVKLGYNWYHENGAVYWLDGLRTRIPRPLKPGESADLQAILHAPDAPGRYRLHWDLVYDPYFWFKERGSPPLEIEVAVAPQ